MRRSLPGSLVVRSGLRFLRAYARPSARRFARHLENPEAAQREVLARLVRKVAKTEYGRSHGVQPSDDYAAFRSKLPVVRYDDLTEWIEAEKESAGQLVADPVLHYQPTEGIDGPVKLIPYTQSLKRIFERMFMVWIHDLLTCGPALTKAWFYLHVPSNLNTAPGSMVEETEFLSGPIRALTRRFLITDPRVRLLEDPDDFLQVLALQLLSAADLEIVHIWDPAVFNKRLDYIYENRAVLASALEARGISRQGMLFKCDPLSPARLAALDAREWSGVWPSLKIISTWTTAQAELPARELRRRFPRVFIQGKGVLSVEAPVTLPLISAKGYVPVINELLYELESASGTVIPLHEAVQGLEYAVIISQDAGLSRYRTGDRVQVSHRYKDTPCLEFVGREPPATSALQARH